MHRMTLNLDKKKNKHLDKINKKLTTLRTNPTNTNTPHTTPHSQEPHPTPPNRDRGHHRSTPGYGIRQSHYPSTANTNLAQRKVLLPTPSHNTHTPTLNSLQLHYPTSTRSNRSHPTSPTTHPPKGEHYSPLLPRRPTLSPQT